MLNEDSPATEIKKVDLAKIKKLEEALAKLKSGEECYYSITKLSSIKSLCQNETIRQHYCWYLFDCVKRQLPPFYSSLIWQPKRIAHKSKSHAKPELYQSSANRMNRPDRFSVRAQ